MKNLKTIMTYRELKEVLINSSLFTANEIELIMHSTGTASLYYVINVCKDILNINLTDNDIEILQSTN